MKLVAKVGNGPVNKELNFGGDPDHRSGSDMDRDTGKTCPGGGMHCPNASSRSFSLRFTALGDRYACNVITTQAGTTAGAGSVA